MPQFLCIIQLSVINKYDIAIWRGHRLLPARRVGHGKPPVHQARGCVGVAAAVVRAAGRKPPRHRIGHRL